MDFIGRGAPLSDSGVDAVAARLRVERAALWAVITVETSGFGFQTDRRPKILFERHVFEQQTGGRFSSAAPELSNSEPGGYGRPGAEQYARLERAMRSTGALRCGAPRGASDRSWDTTRKPSGIPTWRSWSAQ